MNSRPLPSLSTFNALGLFFAISRATMMKCMIRFSFLFFYLLISPSLTTAEPLQEHERIEEYEKRYNSTQWPPEIIPKTEGWERSIYRRLAQTERVADDHDRYNAYMQVLSSAMLVANFTEHGWGLTRAPEKLVKELRDKLHTGMESPNLREENHVNVIEGENPPLFIDIGELSWKTLKELKPMHEKWSGVELEGALAYGLRVYRNNSALSMHTDKPQTHVISCILHVDHDPDSEPWPIFIEDYDGNTNEVVLESGDMLFYESSKCIHGRPRRFQGSWYSSIFVHYYPTSWQGKDYGLESHYAVPPHWYKRQPRDDRLDELTMLGTSFKEPNCPDNWCSSEHAIKWNGPAKEGIVISTGYEEEVPIGDDEF